MVAARAESSSAFVGNVPLPRMMVRQQLMHELFHFTHDRLAHLLGADDLAAFRLDVRSAQACHCVSNMELLIWFLCICLLRFPHEQIVWVGQPETITLNGKLTFHFDALPISERVDQQFAHIVEEARDVYSAQPTFDQSLDRCGSIKGFWIFSNLRNNPLKPCAKF